MLASRLKVCAGAAFLVLGLMVLATGSQADDGVPGWEKPKDPYQVEDRACGKNETSCDMLREYCYVPENDSDLVCTGPNGGSQTYDATRQLNLRLYGYCSTVSTGNKCNSGAWVHCSINRVYESDTEVKCAIPKCYRYSWVTKGSNGDPCASGDQ
jgi:hypothetical protein